MFDMNLKTHDTDFLTVEMLEYFIKTTLEENEITDHHAHLKTIG